MANKHGQLALSTGTASRLFLTDLQLPLSGPESVAERSVVIHGANSGGARLACASFVAQRIIPSLSAVLHIASADAVGTITLTQSSPLTPIVARVNLQTSFQTLSLAVAAFPKHPFSDPSSCSLAEMGSLATTESLAPVRLTHTCEHSKPRLIVDCFFVGVDCGSAFRHRLG
jgi:hypothetical protein